jgi:hypothetical protein
MFLLLAKLSLIEGMRASDQEREDTRLAGVSGAATMQGA